MSEKLALVTLLSIWRYRMHHAGSGNQFLQWRVKRVEGLLILNKLVFVCLSWKLRDKSNCLVLWSLATRQLISRMPRAADSLKSWACFMSQLSPWKIFFLLYVCGVLPICMCVCVIYWYCSYRQLWVNMLQIEPGYFGRIARVLYHPAISPVPPPHFKYILN